MATKALLAVIFSSSSSLHFERHTRSFHLITRSFSSDTNSFLLQPPDVSRLAETARISLTPAELEECEPKILQVIGWFDQLQQVDVNSVEPAIRAEIEGGNLREDTAETFVNSLLLKQGEYKSFSSKL